GRPAIERGVVAEIAGIGAIAVGDKDFGVHLTEHAAKCYFAAVGRPGRIGVGAAFDQALYFPGFYIHAEDFRVVFPGRLQVIVRAKDHLAAVGRPSGMDVLVTVVGKQLFASAIGVHHVDGVAPGFVRDIGDPAAVRRPRRRVVIGGVASQLSLA